ncbi:MAG TPA: hypothetical protein VFI41_04435 [Gemmatimonadales bacterium]|nr:hypothetical protein [Gemmatimonadales bacterium]
MHRVTTRSLLGSAVLVSVLLASCSTGTESGSFEPDIASMTITVITQTGTVGTDYTATDAANGFGAAIATVPIGLFHVVGTFYRPNGSREPSLPPQDFALRVSTSSTNQVLPPGISFEQDPATPLEGTIAGMEAGQELIFYFSLYHTSQGHPDFGPYALRIRYAAPPPPGGGGGGGDL